MPQGNTFTCSCPSGFTGSRCETKDPCFPNPVTKLKYKSDSIFFIFCLKSVEITDIVHTRVLVFLVPVRWDSRELNVKIGIFVRQVQ